MLRKSRASLSEGIAPGAARPPQRRSAADEQPPEGVESPFHAYSILRLPKVMPPIFPIETHPSLAPGD